MLYTSHRDAAVRRAAIKALGRARIEQAAARLQRALGDQDAGVQGAAASALGNLRARSAVADLERALDNRVYEAAAAIASVCEKDQCKVLLDRLGKLPFDVVTGALAIVLYRPKGEVGDGFKIRIVEHVRELGTLEAHKFLEDLSKSKGLSKELKVAVDDAVRAAGVSP
jgi:HEAT repeat protein